jgi:hypothetical protein
MSTSAITFLSDDYKADPVPKGLVALIGRRACNEFYNFIVTKFRASKITQSELARRTGKSSAQINRWLASPHNWTVETAAILLFGITGETFKIGAQQPVGHAQKNYSPLYDQIGVTMSGRNPNTSSEPSSTVTFKVAAVSLP